jgi:branched-chain amino acid transport system substrate-binding protein
MKHSWDVSRTSPRRRRTRLTAAIAATAVAGALMLAGCGDSSSSDGADSGGGDKGGSYRVYASLSLSGPLAAIGTAERDGLVAAAEVLNRSGGIDGHEVVLDINDDGSDPTQAVSLLQRKMTGGDKPDLVWPGSTSNVTLALCPILMQQRVLALGITASTDISDLDRCGYNFVMGPTPADSQGAVAEQMAERGYRKVAVLLSNDAYGAAVQKAVEETFPRAGLEITGLENFAPDALDASPQLRKLRGTNPDVLFIEGQGAAIGKVLESRQQLGWTVPVVGGTGFGGSNVAALVGPDALRDVVMWQWAIGVTGEEPIPDLFEQTALPAIQRQAKGGMRVAANLYTGGYDALMVADAAARAARSTDSTAMRDALRRFSENPPADPQWVMLSKYPYTAERNFSGLLPGDFTLALPRRLDDKGQVPPAPAAG